MLNKVMLIGRLGADPEVRSMPNGGQVANFSIATSETWKDKNTGERQERTEWHRVVVFGKLADVIANYVKKGSQLYLEGRLQTRKWQDAQGQDRYTTEVVLDLAGKMVMLGGKDSGSQQRDSYQQSSGPAAGGAASDSKNASAAPDIENPADLDDDIPF